MREIKFRAWDQSKKKMRELSLLGLMWQRETDLTVYGVNDHNGLVSHSIKDNVPVMQYTGLKDKNGKEIYEGDIVTYNRSVGNWIGQYMTTTHEIVFSEDVFSYVMKYGSSYIKLRKNLGYEYEVIGNIYEKPELLNK